MTKVVNTQQIKTSKKYAEALFDIAQKYNKTDIVLSNLHTVADAFGSSRELCNFFANPIITNKDKKDVIKELFETRTEQITLNFLYLLTDNYKMDLLPDIALKFNEIKLDKQEIITVKAISAVIMKDFLKEKLKNKLESLLSKKVEIEYEVKAEIIAGLIVEIEGKTIDNSVLRKIKNIKKQLI